MITFFILYGLRKCNLTLWHQKTINNHNTANDEALKVLGEYLPGKHNQHPE